MQTTLAREQIAAWPVDIVQIKGKTQGTLVYELLGLAADLDDAMRLRIADTATAFESSQRGDFASCDEQRDATRRLA